MFDIKKLFTPNTTLGRLEFLKVYICILIFPCLVYVLAILIPPNNFFSNIAWKLLLVTGIFCTIVDWTCVYKRIKNIFDNKKITIICFIMCLSLIFIPSDRFLGLHIFPNDNLVISALILILLITIPGKKESDKIISNKVFYFIFSAILVLAFVLQFSGIQFNMTGSAMAETLLPNDKIFVNIFEKNYTRGDIIVHKTEEGKMVYVKRIIGLPGEKIEIRWNNKDEYSVYINDKKLDEPYVSDNKNWIKCTYGMSCRYSKIPDNSYFVMGDNRGNSLDSRHYGAISKDKIKGRVMRTFYPLERAREFKRF